MREDDGPWTISKTGCKIISETSQQAMAWRGEARARDVMRDVIHKPKMPVAVAVRSTKYAVRTVVEPKVEWGQSCIFVPRTFLGVYSRERWIEPFHLYQSRITGNLPHACFRPRSSFIARPSRSHTSRDSDLLRSQPGSHPLRVEVVAHHLDVELVPVHCKSLTKRK
jgi:hypothetical protein